MIPFAVAVDAYLNKLVREAFEALDGIPDDDLNTWKPKQDLADINTFAALATHFVAAGEFWTLHAVGGQPTNRDRPAEFHAHASYDELRTRFDKWLAGCREMLAGLKLEDLEREVTAQGHDEKFLLGDRLLHAIGHSATHVGHLQIQRQLYDAEHNS
jgi:hypothetical protein